MKRQNVSPLLPNSGILLLVARVFGVRRRSHCCRRSSLGDEVQAIFKSKSSVWRVEATWSSETSVSYHNT